jgi:hypothetical protein
VSFFVCLNIISQFTAFSSKIQPASVCMTLFLGDYFQSSKITFISNAANTQSNTMEWLGLDHTLPLHHNSKLSP